MKLSGLLSYRIMKTKTLLLVIVFGFSVQAFAGKADSISVYSESMKKNVPCMVITPSSYKKNNKPYNVIFLLHGYSGNQNQWLRDAPQLTTLADTYNFIIVCPDGGFNSWYFDSPKDPTYKYETFVSGELVKYIDKNYNTRATKNSRAITGLSMGGHGALFLASRHTDTYGAAGSLAGGVNMRPFPNNWDIAKKIGDTACCEENWIKYSVVNVIETLKNKDLKLVIDCGVDDFFLNVNRELHKKLLERKIDHDYTERPGGHTGEYWGKTIDYQLLAFHLCFNSHETAKK